MKAPKLYLAILAVAIAFASAIRHRADYLYLHAT